MRPACSCCPGAVDVHTHMRIPSDEEPDRFFQDSVAAAFGGTTTFLAFNNPGTGISEAAQRTLRGGHRASGAPRPTGESAVDFGLSAVITAQQEDPRPTCEARRRRRRHVQVLPRLRLRGRRGAAAGAARGGRRSGGLLQVHGEDRALLDEGIARQLEPARRAPRYHADVPAAARRGDGHGARHRDRRRGRRAASTSCTSRAAAALDAIAARARSGQAGLRRDVSPLPVARRVALRARPTRPRSRVVISPPLRRPRDQAALWDALGDGRLDLVATDHVPDRLAVEKRWQRAAVHRDLQRRAGHRDAAARSSTAAASRRAADRSSGWSTCCRRRPRGSSGCATRVPSRSEGRRPRAARPRRARGHPRRATCTTRATSRPYEGMELPGVIRRVIVRGADVVVGDRVRRSRGRAGRYVRRALT